MDAILLRKVSVDVAYILLAAAAPRRKKVTTPLLPRNSHRRTRNFSGSLGLEKLQNCFQIFQTLYPFGASHCTTGPAPSSQALKDDKPMSLILPAILLFMLVAAYVYLWRSSHEAVKFAREYQDRGGLLIDVRSPAEFKSGHLPRAINLPLNELDTYVPRLAQDKNQILLLHCKTGLRSELAAQRLKRQGYAKAFNLGSYGRAARLILRNQAQA
jgi:phage shock protein E